jgi:hypothetical protein
MNDKKMDPIELRVRYTSPAIEGFLNPPNKAKRSLTSAVISPIYNSSNTYNQITKCSGHQERIITVVLPVNSEVREAAEGFSLKHHIIHACKDVVKNKDYYHG